MIERRIVRRYATALFRGASKMGLIDQVESDLGLVTFAMESSKDLMDAIKAPVIPAQKKREIMQAIFGDKVTELTLSYLYLLVDHRREEAILQTEEEYILLANEARGMVTVQVTTAIELTEDEQSRLKTQLGALTGKHVALEKIISPDIIGGVIVQIKDRIIDGSVRGQLAALKEELLS